MGKERQRTEDRGQQGLTARDDRSYTLSVIRYTNESVWICVNLCPIKAQGSKVQGVRPKA